MSNNNTPEKIKELQAQNENNAKLAISFAVGGFLYNGGAITDVVRIMQTVTDDYKVAIEKLTTPPQK